MYYFLNKQDIYFNMEESILDFIFQSGGVGLQFYNPAEYASYNTLYTVIDSDDKYVDIEWSEDGWDDFGNLHHDSETWFRFINKLRSGFYVIKNTDYLYQAMGVETNINMNDVFGNLNEGTYKPKLNLRFDPPICNIGGLRRVMKVMDIIEPNVTWSQGKKPSDIPENVEMIFEEDECIWYITVGYYRSGPDRLTYTSCYDDPYMCDDDHKILGYIDGWQWYKRYEFDADETSSMFDTLT
jgi:hypothetical protein